MARMRSPNYPCISVSEALAKVRLIYAQEHRNVMSRAVAASHLGYGGLHGASASLISALLKYGLLEGRGDQLRVSQEAVAAITDPEDESGRAAVRRAAFRPEIFAHLRSHFGEPPPSEENLRVHLARRGFTAQAAGKAARVYLDTVARLPTTQPASPAHRSTSRREGSNGAGEAVARTTGGTEGVSGASWSRSITVRLPLPGDNWMEVQVGRKLSSSELHQIRPLLIDVLERCLTDLESSNPSQS